MLKKLIILSLLVSFVSVTGYVCALDLKSFSFREGTYIPKKYTCSGGNYSPSLEWSDVPSNTESFAIICDDPDAPGGVWVHWVIFNIPGNVTRLRENIPKVYQLPNGAIQGVNDFGRIGYGGPCPPPGRPHRYFFKLYALDTKLNLSGKVTKEELLSAMRGHVLDKACLMGFYSR